LENKKIGFEVVVRGEKKVFTPEQVMGYYLKKVKTYFEKAGMMSKEIVISVPTYATNSERQAYLDAAEIAGIKCIRLINESTATALTYGFFRKADLDDKKERVVAFVDFGHSKLSITYAVFVKTKMRVIQLIQTETSERDKLITNFSISWEESLRRNSAATQDQTFDAASAF